MATKGNFFFLSESIRNKRGFEITFFDIQFIFEPGSRPSYLL